MPYLVAADLPASSAGARFRALLERRAATRWVRVKTVALGRGPFGSGADLHLKLARGTRLRVSLSQVQVGRCYLPAWATTVLS